MREIVGRMRPTGKPKLFDQSRDDDATLALVKGDAQRFNFCNVFNVVTFLRNVLRQN